MSATSLAEANRIVILSGAGLSTAAGIPDFRGPNGLWTKDPYAELVSDISWYLRDEDVRKAAWRRRCAPEVWAAQPTAAHRAIVELEKQGRLHGIVTQNTDGLHQLAGSSPELVHEVHGSMRRWRCEMCGRTGPMEEMRDRVHAGEDDPRCPDCGGITRATVILFGEVLEPDVIEAAITAVEGCDAIVAVGTTLGVYPVAGLFPTAIQRGAHAMIVNDSETPMDHLAHEVVRAARRRASGPARPKPGALVSGRSHPKPRMFDDPPAGSHRDAELTVELVLRAVEQIPPGTVAAYGDIAEVVGTSARRVGTIMARHGGEVSWWRVTNRDGALPAHLLPLARKQWGREGIEHDHARCRISQHRVDLTLLAADYAAATDGLDA